MVNRATGERKKQILLMNRQQTTNEQLQMIVNSKRLSDLRIPAGISRIAVRGFFASNCLSRYRLKAIAALRANNMQRITNINVSHNGLGFLAPYASQLDGA